MEKLQGKIALITGGSSGIGRAAALAFVREGAKVVLAARGEERGAEVAQAIKRAGGDAVFVKADMAKASDIESLVGRAIELYGRLDIAFNNAAMPGENLRPLADFTEEEFDHIVSVNLKAVWLCMKYEIRQMLGQEPQGGTIVNTSSINGLD
jgi:NAD(P)-dependent dehydrogenase (short-subunit alcohol dehydrogenase family)